MKKNLLTLIAVLAGTLSAAPEIRRAEVIPGATAVPTARYEKFTLTDAYTNAGTVALWIRPEGWNNDDKAWHFFCIQDSGAKQMMLYRFPTGKTRMLFKVDGKNAAELVAEIPFASGKWTHLAFTWKRRDNSNYTDFALYVDGKKVKSRRSSFVLESVPEKLRVGDVPTWNPKSNFGSTLGRVELHDRALSEAEIAALASAKK